MKGSDHFLIELIFFQAWFDYRLNSVRSKVPGITIGGLYNRDDSFAVAVAHGREISAYVNPNPIRMKSTTTPLNKLRVIRKGEGVALDDLAFLRWLIVDIDPVSYESRRAVNSTEEEHQACLDLRDLILDQEPTIREASWFGSSGNGAFIMIVCVR
jgi:hypothetical protein